MHNVPLDRRAVLMGAAAAILTRRSAPAAQDDPTLIDRDYALDRKGFRTRIVSPGPAPEDGAPLTEAPTGARYVTYRSGKLDLLAWRSLPISGGKRPAVLVLHGGNALGQIHWDLARPYVQAGYAVMMPSLRGENGQAGIFSGFYDEVEDVLAAGRALAAEPDVDPARIFVAGHSIGGTLTMLTALTTPMFRAASSLSGSPDAFAFFRRFPEDIRFDTTDPREFQMRSAVCYATSFKCPTLIQRSATPAQTSGVAELTARRARGAGLEVESVTVPGDHSSAVPEQISKSLAFFAKLGGRP